MAAPPLLETDGGTVLTIWFNRTYSTHTHTIRMLRQNPAGEPVRIVATHAAAASPVLAVADIVEPEPPERITAEEYVRWALDLCRRHGVDVLLPRLHALAIADARDAFAAAGVAVVAPPAAAIVNLDDKVRAYERAAEQGLPVPPYRVVRTGDELRDAARELESRIGAVCMKPVVGVGGQGFFVLEPGGPSLEQLLGPLEPRLSLGTAVAALEAAPGTAPPMLVMPVLPGPEVSVDCLADADGRLLATVPRHKDGHRRWLGEDPAAVSVAAAVVERERLAFLSNTQVRYWRQPGVDDEPRPYLLETNPRPAGGLHQTELAGVNLAWAAVELALGREVAPLTPRLGATYSMVPAVLPHPRR